MVGDRSRNTAMKIKIKNLGVLKQAEFTLGDLTIICGGNNTGKTYASYALFGFFYTSFCLYRSYQHSQEKSTD
jgi:predicted ATPase